MNDVSDRYGPTYPAPPALSYDPAMYWADDAHYAQIDKSIELRDDKHAEQYCQETLDRAVAHAVAHIGWDRYHSEETCETGGMVVHIRRTLYECPLYREICRYRGPLATRDLRIIANNRTIVELPLRRLMDHDHPAFGALHEETLYIVEIIAHA